MDGCEMCFIYIIKLNPEKPGISKVLFIFKIKCNLPGPGYTRKDTCVMVKFISLDYNVLVQRLQ